MRPIDEAMLSADLKYVIMLLPLHYVVKESKKPGNIHCYSKKGIRQGFDSEDEEAWGYIVAAIKKHFGGRFREIDHNVNFCHTDFTIFLHNPSP